MKKSDFAKRLGEIIGDYKYAEKLENRCYDSFIAEHKANSKMLAEEHEREINKWKGETNESTNT